MRPARPTLLAALLLAGTEAHAAPFTIGWVDPATSTSTGCIYNDLQTAVFAAPAGATIYVKGMNPLTGTIFLTKDVTILSGDLSAPCDDNTVSPLFVDATAAPRAFTVTGGATVLLGDLHILGGATAEGGALWLASGTTLHLSRTDITGGDAIRGGQVFVSSGATFSVGGSLLTEGTADDGGSIYVDGGGTAILEFDTIAMEHTADRGGVLFVQGEALVRDAVVAFGEATDGGNAYLDGGRLELDDGSLLFGEAEVEGGNAFVTGSGAELVMQSSAIWGGTAGTGGGGVHVGPGARLASTTGSSSAIVGNLAPVGAGISALAAVITLEADELRDNLATGDGGALHATSSLITLTGTTLGNVNPGFANEATRGAGMFVSGGTVVGSDVQLLGNVAATAGGGVFATAGASVTLDDATVDGNQAPTGAGLHLDALSAASAALTGGAVTDNAASTDGGGAFVGATCTLTLDDVEVADNTAASDGAGAMVEGGTTGVARLVVRDTAFERNLAGAHGGGVHVRSGAGTDKARLDVVRGDFLDNEAGITTNSRGGGIGVQGGSLVVDLLDGSTLECTGTCLTLDGNAADRGAGLAVFAGGAAKVRRAEVHDNTSTVVNTGIGIDAAFGSTLLLEDSLFTGNACPTGAAAAVAVLASSVGDLRHNTIRDNSRRGLLLGANSITTLHANIVFDNNAGVTIDPAASAVMATCNDTQGSALTGTGNVSIAPAFDAGGFPTASALIDACSTDPGMSLSGASHADPDGSDMGAFEVPW
ncbi:MAG: right-handed parallel beta-helix repeat-containing protein [Alphaproteobacteria bacterium]|nr:right-handed parallel beta-helix repeat-containing protein [Alphaproteobacteria bacterium]